MSKRKKPRMKRGYLKQYSSATLNAGKYWPHKPSLSELSRRATSGVTTKHVKGEMFRDVEVETAEEKTTILPGIHKSWNDWEMVYLKRGTLSSWKMYWKSNKYILVFEDHAFNKVSVSHPFDDRMVAMRYYSLGVKAISWEIENEDLHT